MYFVCQGPFACSNACLVGLLIRSILRGKIARALRRECSFSSENMSELTDLQDMFCFNHACTFYTSDNIERDMLINNKFKAQTLIRIPTGNSRCHALMSRALNVSCSFGQSARSIESRCVVMETSYHVFCTQNDTKDLDLHFTHRDRLTNICLSKQHHH